MLILKLISLWLSFPFQLTFVKLSLHVNFCKIFKDEGLGLSLVREIGLFEGGRQISKSCLPPVIVSIKDLGLGN